MICAHQITGNHFGKWPMLWYSFWSPTCNHISSRAHRTVSFKSLMGLKRSWAIQCWKNSAGQPASLEEWIDDVSSRTFFRMGLEGLKGHRCIPPTDAAWPTEFLQHLCFAQGSSICNYLCLHVRDNAQVSQDWTQSREDIRKWIHAPRQKFKMRIKEGLPLIVV